MKTKTMIILMLLFILIICNINTVTAKEDQTEWKTVENHWNGVFYNIANREDETPKTKTTPAPTPDMIPDLITVLLSLSLLALLIELIKREHPLKV